MPTYVFRCPKCRKEIELHQKISKDGPIPPLCVEFGCDGHQRMETVLKPPAIIFKGSGWTPKGGN